MTQSSVVLNLKADTSAFSNSIRQAEQEFSSRFKQMGSTSSAQSKQIKGNFNNIGESAKKFSSHIRQAAKQLTVMAGAAAGVGFLAKKMLDTADNLAKTADRIGFTTDALQELRFAASQTGVATLKLDTSLERFTKRIGEASAGMGAAASTYKRLGISVTEADGSLRTSESVLNEVANALQGMESQAEKAAVTAALFGREGVALSLLLNTGAKGIKEYRDQAKALGLVIDEELLRNSEKAVDQIDILTRIIKAQLITAFIQLAPSVINFTQGIVSSIPAMKELISSLSGIKDALVFIGKVVIGIKLVSFSKGLISMSKSFAITAGAAAKFSASMVLMSKALKGIGIGLAVGVAVEALSLFKQHLDFKESVSNYLQSQKTIIKANQKFANFIKLNIDQFKNLSKAEQISYKERLLGAQQYWNARLSLESRKDYQSDTAFEAARENRILLNQISEVDSILTQRDSLASNHAQQLDSIKQEETFQLKAKLKEQLSAYDQANNQLKSLQDKRLNIAKEFQQLIQEINQPKRKAAEDLTVLDITAAQTAAKAALNNGDIDQAYQAINSAKSIIQSLSKTGNVTKSYLTEQAKATAKIAEGIVQSEIQAQEKNIALVRDNITQIKADAEGLHRLSIDFDVDSALQSAEEMRNQIQAQLKNNPILIPAVVVPEGQSIDSRADSIIKPQKRARGGLLSGPGTSMSDSILARLSTGEFVVRASAVKRYGVNLLNKINHMQLPKFATGGPVPPRVPALSQSSPSSSQTASLTLNLGSNNFAIQTQNVDVVQALTKAVAREALKSGRRI